MLQISRGPTLLRHSSIHLLENGNFCMTLTFNILTFNCIIKVHCSRHTSTQKCTMANNVSAPCGVSQCSRAVPTQLQLHDPISSTQLNSNSFLRSLWEEAALIRRITSDQLLAPWKHTFCKLSTLSYSPKCRAQSALAAMANSFAHSFLLYLRTPEIIRCGVLTVRYRHRERWR